MSVGTIVFVGAAVGGSVGLGLVSTAELCSAIAPASGVGCSVGKEADSSLLTCSFLQPPKKSTAMSIKSWTRYIFLILMLGNRFMLSIDAQ
jgi:hypothetical protein